jgi:multisubunit Na+/H+ antiporter MnhE subunit
MSGGPILLSFCIWMLLTGVYTVSNGLIGLLAACAVSLVTRHRYSAWQLLYLVISMLVWIPKMLWESLLIVLMPHRHERISTRPIRYVRNPWAVFSQTLVITLTPKSLVVGEEKKGQLKIHSVERKEPI